MRDRPVAAGGPSPGLAAALDRVHWPGVAPGEMLEVMSEADREHGRPRHRRATARAQAAAVPGRMGNTNRARSSPRSMISPAGRSGGA